MPSSAARLALAHNFQPVDPPPQTPLFPRIAFVIAALLAYRLGAYIPLSGVDASILAPLLSNSGASMLASTAMQRLSIFGLGVWPYISASLIMLCLIWLIPPLAAMAKSHGGRLRINQSIRWLTGIVAGVQGYSIANALGPMAFQGNPAVSEPGLLFQLQTAVTYAGASLFLVWLAERITARGLGNGVLLLLFTDIAADLPRSLATTLLFVHQGAFQPRQAYFLGALMLAAIAGVVFVELARRRIPLEHPGRAPGGVEVSLPLHLNPSGLAPLFMVSALPAMPAVIAYFVAPAWFSAEGRHIFGVGSPAHFAIAAGLIFLFAMAFRTSCGSDPVEIAARLEKSGAFIRGIAPGANTAAYIARIQTRIAVFGGLYLAAFGVLPGILYTYAGAPFMFDGWRLLVAVIAPLAVMEGVRGAR
jgi:preprotein translocase subunit SecY